MRCYLFDIDGTLADLSHRLPHIQKTPKDWDAFFDACEHDAPIPHMLGVANTLAVDRSVVFVSGRAERCRAATMAWLKKHLPLLEWEDDARELYMRKDGDHRPDNEVKLELLEKIRADGYEPIMAFDDRDQVVKMWRGAGIPCAQVADGDF
jgi:phosphoglycolate phosphatase-like HAD superfamily hydrolase